jgi:disulfide bond formation protein DsbB
LIRTRAQRRLANLAGFAIVVGLLGYALYAQQVMELQPCPLCVFQRAAFMGVGLVLLAAGLHGPRGTGARAYALAGLLPAGIGGGIAARHVYIQSLPADQVPACGPGLDYILDAFPLLEALELVFTGSGECAAINWSFLGLTIPGWALVWFVLLGGLALCANWARLSR